MATHTIDLTTSSQDIISISSTPEADDFVSSQEVVEEVENTTSTDVGLSPGIDD